MPKSSDTLASVRHLYERQPYPLPMTNLDAYRDHRLVSRGVPAAHFQYYWPHQSQHDDLDILIAGCGTSQAVECALWQPGSRIVATDISQASLDHTQMLAEKYQVKNLELHLLPIEQTEQLQRDFDFIACTGVLHHMQNPSQGLRALRQALRREGSLYIMVYGQYGRLGVYMFQEYCKLLNIRINDSELADLAQLFQNIPPDHPLVPMAKRTSDMQSPNGLADLFLHPQDRAYTVPQIYDWLEACDMTLQRWLHQALYLPRACGLAQTPHLQRIEQLPPPTQHAAVELFRGHLNKHFLIACRNDRPIETWQIRFEDGYWQKLIPLSLPTVTPRPIKNKKGVLAELINSAHEHPMHRPYLTSQNIRLYQLMNGKRTLEQIARDCDLPDPQTKVVTFFKFLWDFDQVMFQIQP